MTGASAASKRKLKIESCAVLGARLNCVMRQPGKRLPAGRAGFKVSALVSLNLALLFGIDRLFGVLFPAPPVFLNKKTFDYDSYATNPRGYFDIKGERDGQIFFSIDRSHEKDRSYEFARIPKDSIPIVAIGDSFTFGQGVKLKDTYIKRLERIHSRRPIYGLDCAVSGANIRRVVREFDDYFSNPRRPNPALIIYGYVLNDPYVGPGSGGKISELAENANTDDDELRYPLDLINLRTNVVQLLRSPSARFLASHSRIMDYAIAAMERRDMSLRAVQYYLDIHDPLKNGQGLSRTLDAIQSMKDASERKGARFVVALFPIFYKIGSGYPFLKVHAYLSAQLRARGVDVVDLYPGYVGYKDEDLWVHPVDQHPNELAQKIAANEIEAWMRQNTALLR